MKRSSLYAALVLAAVMFVSCDVFFSTSWGQEREYDPSKISLDSGNLDTWIEKSIGNPKLAAAITEKIIKELPGKTGAEKAKFQEAGVELAVEASGIGALMVGSAGSVLDGIKNKDENAFKDLFAKVQGDFGSGGAKAAENIATIINSDITPSNPGNNSEPSLDNSKPYAQALTPGAATEAAMVLFLEVLHQEGINAKDLDVNDFTNGDGIKQLPYNTTGTKLKLVGSPSPEAIALAAYVNYIAGESRFNEDPLTELLRECFNTN